MSPEEVVVRTSRWLNRCQVKTWKVKGGLYALRVKQGHALHALPLQPSDGDNASHPKKVKECFLERLFLLFISRRVIWQNALMQSPALGTFL